jgi:hypothetical protein
LKIGPPLDDPPPFALDCLHAQTASGQVHVTL